MKNISSMHETTWAEYMGMFSNAFKYCYTRFRKHKLKHDILEALYYIFVSQIHIMYTLVNITIIILKEKEEKKKGV